MVEGCNAISVIILFVAFIFAFYKGTKTFVFIALSLLILYIMNVLRIVGLNIISRDYHEYNKIGHDYVFPAVIYGSVVVLWLVWIKFFALKMKILNWFLVIVGVFGLVGVRMLEDQIFYDPFLNFFHEGNKDIPFPEFEWGKLIISHIFRFVLNLFFHVLSFIFYLKIRNGQFKERF